MLSRRAALCELGRRLWCALLGAATARLRVDADDAETVVAARCRVIWIGAERVTTVSQGRGRRRESCSWRVPCCAWHKSFQLYTLQLSAW